MEELRLAMKREGIPRKWINSVATTLGINSLEDLTSMQRETVDLAPRIYHRRIINLRNAYNIARTMWDLPDYDD